jgi:6,7-dimethyl-8-ribityllumazine synthase
MIKSLCITRRVYKDKDSRAIKDFLDAVGLEQLPDGGDENWVFVAPAGRLWLSLLSDKHSPQFRELAEDWDRDFILESSDPESIWFIAHKRGYEITRDSISKRTGEHNFAIKLPGGLVVTIREVPEQSAGIGGDLSGLGKRFAVVVSRFNSFITERLLQGTIDGLTRSGVDKKNVQIVRVPGSFEIPSAARTLAETKKYDAIICLGCLLRGDTAHYDVIVNEVTRGIGQSAQETGVPHAFGVLTCDTLEQAIDRAGLKMGNKGFEAALAAVEMANLKKVISHQSTLSKEQIPRSARNDKSERARNDKSERDRNDKPDRPRKRSKEPLKASKAKRRK